MAEPNIVSTTKLCQVFSETKNAATDLHNLRIKIKRTRARTRCRQYYEVTGESEEEKQVYVPRSIYQSRDTLPAELRNIFCGGLGLNLDDGTVNGVAEVVYNNLKNGVCDDDDVVLTVVVLIMEILEMEILPDDDGDRRTLESVEIEDVSDKVLDQCPICWDGLFAAGVDQAVKLIPCDHVFHGSCIREWLRRRTSCPMCRQPIRVD